MKQDWYPLMGVLTVVASGVFMVWVMVNVIGWIANWMGWR